MHDAIHRELQKARVADLHRRAQQDRLERDAARQLRHRALGRLLAVLSVRRSALREPTAQAATSDAAPPGFAPLRPLLPADPVRRAVTVIGRRLP